tara:strand:- start:570 stop:1061 length:492 start_codon:yes stop_codon:yes gene_type:complete
MFINPFKQILKWTLIFLLSFTTFNFFISGKIEESVEIKAPIDLVYLKVADLRTWSVWQKKDTAVTIIYSGQKSGLGAKMSWTGIDGVGSLEIIKTNFPKDLINELIFEGMSPSYHIWTFEKTNKGTKVTWSLQDELPFYIHFIQLFISSELKEGLNGLKKLCE